MSVIEFDKLFEKEFELEKEHYKGTKIYQILQLVLSEIRTDESEVEEVNYTKIV